jgi:hypothetical protein
MLTGTRGGGGGGAKEEEEEEDDTRYRISVQTGWSRVCVCRMTLQGT